jgi:hypothetical protein
MTVTSYADPIARATIGLPEAEARALRRFLMGHRIGSAGATIQRKKVARRLRRWLAVRRAEEAAAMAWLARYAEGERGIA